MVCIKDLSSDAETNVSYSPRLVDIASASNMSLTRKGRLHKMLYECGPGNGTMLNLPFDQLVEHNFAHMLGWQDCGDPRAVIELANKGCFSAIALHIGQAEKYRRLMNIPLIVKVDGHASVGKEVPNPRHSNMSSVERAVEAGANAIGFTLYVGGLEMEQDIERCAQIIEKAHRLDMPTVMWAYSRGPLPNQMGTDSLFWCCQGISLAESLGADIVKQKFPRLVESREAYKAGLKQFEKNTPHVMELLELEPPDLQLGIPQEATNELHVRRLSLMSRIASHTFKIISGGSKTEKEEEIVEKGVIVMDAGLDGLIIGRNFWGRPTNEALELNNPIAEIMKQEKYHRKKAK